MENRVWQAHESYVCDVLGLDATVASGSQWHDLGDATDRGHPSGNGFQLLADAKCTEKKSFSLKKEELKKEVESAREQGKRFIMPVRFWSVDTTSFVSESVTDYVVMTLDDFAEMLEIVRGVNDGNS